MRLVVTLLAMGAALVSLVASRQQSPAAPAAPPLITTPAGSAAVEQTTLGTRRATEIMSRLVYRRISNRESIVSVHSVNTTAGGGGVLWYEFRLDRMRNVALHQQGTYAPDGLFRWMASPAIDRFGNIGIGYSFGGPAQFAGQRFAARVASDPPGVLTVHEAVLVEGEDIQTSMRCQDYTQTAIDPSDDCAIWYVGDYIKKDASSYSTRTARSGCRVVTSRPR